MSSILVHEEINIRDFMVDIKKMAIRGLKNMNNRSGFTLEDMISEGVLVFYKDALPHYTHKGQDGHRASFRSYLITCLRNHFFGLMKSSFAALRNDDIFDEYGRQVREDPKVVYTSYREVQTSEVSPDEKASFNVMVEEIRRGLNDRETIYLEMAMADRPRKDIRKALGVSSVTERKIRRGLQKKMIIMSK